MPLDPRPVNVRVPRTDPWVYQAMSEGSANRQQYLLNVPAPCGGPCLSGAVLAAEPSRPLESGRGLPGATLVEEAAAVVFAPLAPQGDGTRNAAKPELFAVQSPK
jgi:hypothetical protein